MKPWALLAGVLTGTVTASGQGTIHFNNYVMGSLIAPIYGPVPGAPDIALHGNPGWVACGGILPCVVLPLLAGTAFTAQLWGGSLAPGPGAEPVLQLLATTTFRTGSAAGFLTSMTLAVPGVLAGERASFEVRVWDNQGGTITSWSQVLVDPTILRGQSGVFSPSGSLGGGSVDAGLLEGLESFNIHTVPEPGMSGLLLSGIVAAWIVRRQQGAGGRGRVKRPPGYPPR